MQDLLTRDGRWCCLLDLHGPLRSYHRVGEDICVQIMDFFASLSRGPIGGLGSCEGWEWGDSEIPFNKIILSTKQVKNLLPTPPSDFSRFNWCLSIDESFLAWRVHWCKLWLGNCHQRNRFIFSRLLNHGYYTNLRGLLWGIHPKCPVCSEPKLTDHMMFSCNRVAVRWEAVRLVANGTKFDFTHYNSFMNILCLTINCQRRCLGLFILVVEIISINCLKRNVVVFRGGRVTIPPIVI